VLTKCIGNRTKGLVLVAGVCGTTFLAGCQMGFFGSDLKTVSNIEIERYMGTWYEIAKYPNGFEQGCFGVTAEYTLRDDGSVRVVNYCRTSDGTRVARKIEGFATVADPSSNAKLTVYFFYPFGAPYWIIDIGANYEYAVVGDPTRSFLWILSRTPTMDQETLDSILERLPSMGYDPSRLEPMPQFPDLAPYGNGSDVK
jgi:apolipoprotein D and lipocalin family protein